MCPPRINISLYVYMLQATVPCKQCIFICVPPVFMATIIDCRLSNRALHVCASGEVGMVLSHQLLVYVFSIAGCLPVNKIPQVVCMQRTEECEALNYALFTQYTVLSMILYVHVGYLHSTQN